MKRSATLSILAILAIAALSVAGCGSSWFVKKEVVRLVATEQPTQSTVFTADKEGYWSYRSPTLLVTPKGTLLAFCEAYRVGGTIYRKGGETSERSDIVFKRSDDGGKTWGRLQPIFILPAGGVSTASGPSPVLDADTGRIWLAFSLSDRLVQLSCSLDGGLSWSLPRDITSSVEHKDWEPILSYSTGSGAGIQIQRGSHKGRLVIPCSHVESVDGVRTSFAHAIYSDDHGVSWQAGKSMAPHTASSQVAELSNGDLLMNTSSRKGYWSRNAPVTLRGASRSGNGGRSWSRLQAQEDLRDLLSEGALLRHSWADTGGKSRLLFSNPAVSGKFPRYAIRSGDGAGGAGMNQQANLSLKVRISYDEGKTWAHSKWIHVDPSDHSSLAALPDGSIGCLQETGEREAHEKILFTRFTIEWLTGGTDQGLRPQAPTTIP